MDIFDLAAKISLDTSEYKKGIDDAQNDTNSFGSKVGSALGTVGKVAGAALTAATGAVTAFASSSVETGKSFDSSMSQVAATMGTTVDAIGELRDYAQEMGATTAFSATQAADALNFMALAGYDAETSMGMLPNVLNLAAAGSMDLASASDMITDASSALGLSIEETTTMVDQMAKASSKSNTSVAQLGNAILTVGGTAKMLTGGTTELSTALGILADNGVKGAEGGTALRNILLSLTPKSDEAAEAMENIGMKAYDANGELRPLADIFRDMNGQLSQMSTQERTNTLSAIFNKFDLKSVNALLAASGDNVALVTQALENSGVEWEKYGHEATWALDDIMYNLDDFKGNLEDAQDMRDYLHFEYDLDEGDVEKVMTAVNAAIMDQEDRWDELSGYIDDASGAAQEMADVQLDNLAGDITLFQSALEGAQIAVSDSLTPTLREFVQFGSKAVSELGTAFKEGGLTGAMDALGTILSDGIAMVTEKLPQFIEAGMGLLSALGQGIMDNLPMLMQAATQIILSLTSFLIEALPDLVRAGLEMIVMLANGIAQALPELIPTIVDVILEIVDVLTDPDNITLLLEAAVAIIIGLADGLIKALPKLIERIPEIVENTAKAIIAAVPIILKAALELGETIIKGLVDGASGAIDSLKEVWSKIKDKFKEGWEKIKEAWAKVGDWAKEKWGDIKNAFEKVGDWFGDKFSKARDKVKEAWQNAGEWFAERKKDVQNAWEGIDTFMGEKFGDGWTKIKEAFAPAVDFFKDVWEGIKKVFEVVKDVLSGDFDDAWKGIQDIWDGVVDWFKGIWDGIKNAFKDVGSWFKGKFDDAVNGIKQIFTNLVDSAKNWGKDLVDNFINGIKSMWGGFTNTVSGLANTVSSFLGFSEPEKGPLSNFHTYAPDMIDLFIKGIKSNEDKLQDAVKSAFDFQPIISNGYSSAGWSGDMNFTINGAAGQSAEMIADIVEKRILTQFTRRKAVWA